MCVVCVFQVRRKKSFAWQLIERVCVGFAFLFPACFSLFWLISSHMVLLNQPKSAGFWISRFWTVWHQIQFECGPVVAYEVPRTGHSGLLVARGPLLLLGRVRAAASERCCTLRALACAGCKRRRSPLPAPGSRVRRPPLLGAGHASRRPLPRRARALTCAAGPAPLDERHAPRDTRSAQEQKEERRRNKTESET